MSGLERGTQENPAQKYIADTRAEVGFQNTKKEAPVEERIIDEDTERTIVSIISAAIVAAPLIVTASKLLPDIPVYHIYRYFQF